MAELYHFNIQRRDLAKQDPELCCDMCDAHVCDIEPGDTLETLVACADNHVCNKEEKMLTQDQRITVAEIADTCGIDLVRGANGAYCFEVRPHFAHRRNEQVAACREKCAYIGIDVSEVLS